MSPARVCGCLDCTDTTFCARIPKKVRNLQAQIRYPSKTEHENLKSRRETTKLSTKTEYWTFSIITVDPNRLIVVLTERLWSLIYMYLVICDKHNYNCVRNITIKKKKKKKKKKNSKRIYSASSFSSSHEKCSKTNKIASKRDQLN